MSHASKKVIIDCSSAPCRLNTLRDMIIADVIKDREAIEAFGEMGMIIDELVKEYVDKYASD